MPVSLLTDQQLRQRAMTAYDAVRCCGIGKSNSSLGVEMLADLMEQVHFSQNRTLLAFVRPIKVGVSVRAPTIFAPSWGLRVFGLTDDETGINFSDYVSEFVVPQTQPEMRAVKSFAKIAAETIRRTARRDCVECAMRHLLTQKNPRFYRKGSYRTREVL